MPLRLQYSPFYLRSRCFFAGSGAQPLDIQTYAVVLATLLCTGLDSTVSRHLHTLLSLCFLLYVYRDVWPLATSTKIPKDIADGWVLWFKVIILAIIGVVLPLIQPRCSKDATTPEEKASLLSRLTYGFLDSLVFQAYRKTQISVSDLPPLANSDRAANLVSRSLPILDFQAKKLLSLNVTSPVRPWFWIAWILIASFLRTVTSERYMYIATRTQVQMEAILQQLIMKHSLRIRINFESSSSHKGSMGKLMNLTSDVANMTAMLQQLINGLQVLFAPVQVALSSWFLYAILGWSALVGLAVMVICLPLPTYLTTDERLQVVTETMSILRMVKLFGWESRMRGRMNETRMMELQAIKKDKMLSLLIGNFNFVIPFLTMIAAYATYTLIMEKALSASTVFSSMAVFELFRLELRKVIVATPVVVKGKVSIDRLDSFLCDTDLLDSFSEQNSSNAIPDGIVAGFHLASFSWDNDSTAKFALEIKEDLIFRPGISLITGPTGTGTMIIFARQGFTGVLKAFLTGVTAGEMRFKALGPDCWFGLDRKNGVAYAPQESWLQNESIRENIVMGAPFNEERYTKVLEQCGLVTDLTLFEQGDLVVVGERGSMLRVQARITLARCIYSSARILLLDDPLAALDVHTATTIVDRCLAGDLVEGRTVLLVTHDVLLTSRVARFMVVLGSDGSIQQGPLDQIFIDAAVAEQTTDGTVTAFVPSGHDTNAGTKFAVKEEVAEGHVGWPAFKLYFSSLSSYPVVFWIFFLGGVALNETSLVVQVWFMGYWSRQYEHREPSEVSPSHYLSMYAILLAFSMVFYSWYFTVFTFGSIRASSVIHGRLMNAIIGSTLRWLDLTPTSRVMTRATQDMRTVDDSIAVGVNRVFQLTLSLCIKFGTVILFSPAFLVPGLVITMLGAFFGQLFMKAQLPVKREMSNARSLTLGHFSAVITGLTSIRAYGIQEKFLQDYFLHIDLYSRTAITYQNLNRWIACRSDILGGAFTALLAAYLVYIRKEDAATTGFVLNNAFGYSIMVLLWVRYINTVELDGMQFRCSLERILEYINVEQQQDPSKQIETPPAHWPASGHVVVDNLTARYSEEGPPILHNISFELKSGERVAVVGRTGSGKSSLILALLRCITTEGSVKYDGIQTDSLDLDVLRSNITIVPQIPELLSGTLRYNLDPFGEHKDSVLYGVLRSSGLYAVQNKTEDRGQLSLDSVISSGGANISVGQRQILALARAIIRDSKLLILDEATSAIDYETEKVIQSTLRHELKSDVTVLTIAHRLQTIMDFDKIMVLEAGKIVEFDSPRVLLEKGNGYLRILVEESVDKETLYAAAAAAQTCLVDVCTS
ncbi:P-loop containing nucleoside triphosphate hydrolase protein [Mycena pura]|uniref:P-loop containing nucleoside triphosphate hydrolase protein n=1 Tax=Mycena pura TaxID=153505 RepID=A0AAD6USI5_9AGAR|nr:P-loop containing nucleoside triphosphate hydrolase protein [Mycena pura]